MQSVSNSLIHNPPDSASSGNALVKPNDPLNPKLIKTSLTYEEELGFREACSQEISKLL